MSRFKIKSGWAQTEVELKEGVAATIKRVTQLLALTEDLMTIAETQNNNGSSILSNLRVGVQLTNKINSLRTRY